MRCSVSPIAAVLAALALSALLAGCCWPVYVEEEPWAPPGHRGSHHYYYYPDSGVYYDQDRNVYYYQGEGHWRESQTLPPGYRVDRDQHRELRMDTDKPYQYHPDVNKKYPPGQWKKQEKDKGKDKD